jgi:hypothetical protein
MFVSYDNFKIAPLSLTFGINLLYQLRNQGISLALYKAFAIEGPSITPGLPNPFVWIAYSACVPTMAFGLSLLVELLRNAP